VIDEEELGTTRYAGLAYARGASRGFARKRSFLKNRPFGGHGRGSLAGVHAGMKNGCAVPWLVWEE
jgi:hypothetical protein